MRRCGQHYHGVTTICKQLRKTRTLRLMISTLCNVLSFIDYNNVPICIFQMSTIFNVSL